MTNKTRVYGVNLVLLSALGLGLGGGLFGFRFYRPASNTREGLALQRL